MSRGVMKSEPGHKAWQGSPLPDRLLCKDNVYVADELEGQEVSQTTIKLPEKHYLPYP